MTLGIDVSRLFSEMVMASYTRDVVQKKLIYHYLANYAQQKSDLALLTINTLQKDTRDEDPMVRGLALRSLCSLRLPNLQEYVMVPLRNCLTDMSAYVRKTAAIGIAKLAEFAPEAVRHSDLIDVLYNMLRDKDSAVITNVIYALNEVLGGEGGMAINVNIIQYLLNRIKEFSDWGQCAVLELVAKYKPASEDEMFDIMNLLEDRLKHSNSAVVLATTKVFLNFTVGNAPLHEEVYRRLKSPMLTLIGSASHELSFSVLGHVQALVTRAPHVFSDSFKEFFCRFNDPSAVKQLKLNIVTSLTTQQNQTDILGELAEYVTDSDPDIGRFAIRSIGKIAVQVPSATDEASEHLLSFLDLNLDHVSTETVIVLKDLLRKYPVRYEEIIPALHKTLKTIEESDGKVAVVWMLGEYGDTIDDAPYILEPLIDGYADEPSGEVRMELLTASMKLFFKRPPELKAMLGRLLTKAVADGSRVDVRDRALMYYRLLKLNVHDAAQIVNCPQEPVDVFAEEHDEAVRAKIFEEFNSLSPLYNLPSDRFVRKIGEEERRALEEAEAADYAAQLAEEAQQQADSGMLSGDGYAGFSIELAPPFAIDKQTYASKWSALQPADTLSLQLQGGGQLTSPPIEQAFAHYSINTFASGTVGNQIKLYLYAKENASGQLLLVESIIDIDSGILNATIKADDPNMVNPFKEIYEAAISVFG